ncbi:MAG TPA: hypothetical protein VL738_37010 [Dactylosporangium sp.]|jgi:hypothetical protein|nr:hypothetical protein [Dactylosporangium sp.]
MDRGTDPVDHPGDDAPDRSLLARLLFDEVPPLYPHEREAMFAHTFDPASADPPTEWTIPEPQTPDSQVHHDDSNWVHEEPSWWDGTNQAGVDHPPAEHHDHYLHHDHFGDFGDLA